VVNVLGLLLLKMFLKKSGCLFGVRFMRDFISIGATHYVRASPIKLEIYWARIVQANMP